MITVTRFTLVDNTVQIWHGETYVGVIYPMGCPRRYTHSRLVSIVDGETLRARIFPQGPAPDVHQVTME